jgi:hypothetical protein
MTTRPQPPPAAAARDDPPAAGRDDSTEQALARSRAIRQKGNRQIQAAREHAAAARRRGGPNARSGPVQESAARLIDAREQIERARQARARLAALAAKLVRTEETIAHIHDDMAARDSPHAAQYRRVADDARQAAARARDIQRDATGPDPR